MDCLLHLKPEVAKVASLLKVHENMVVGGLQRLWGWANQNTADGRLEIGEGSAEFLDRLMGGIDGLAKALCQVGWLEIDESGVTIPKWDRHHSNSAKERDQNAVRQQRHKAKHGNRRAAAQSEPSVDLVAPDNAPALQRKGNGDRVTAPLLEKRREDEIREQKGDPPVMLVSEHLDYYPNVPGGFEHAEQEFLQVIEKSQWIVQPTKRALHYSYKTRFLELWSDEVWREMLPRAVERLETHPPWHNQKLRLEELLKPETVQYILSGGMDKRATSARGNGDRRHLVNGAHPPDPNQVPRF